jgi:uncharacterized membrane protein YhaH (DUF805 family)
MVQGAKGTAQKGMFFLKGRISRSQYLEKTMLELLKSLVFAVIMVPVVMAIILGAIYGLGEVFNVFSNIGHKTRLKAALIPPKRPACPGVLLSDFPVFADTL